MPFSPRLKTLTLVLASLCTLPLYGLQQETPDDKSTDEGITSAQVLLRLEEKARDIRDLSAQFIQEKHTALLRRPLVSKGTVMVTLKPPRMKWDTHKPHPSVMLITTEEVRIYYPQQAILEIYELEDQLGPLASSPILHLSALRDHFQIDVPLPATQGDQVTLKLTPLDPALLDHVSVITLSVHTATGIVSRAEIINLDNELTVLSFEKIRINQGLTEQALELKVSKDTSVVRPLAVPSGDDVESTIDPGHNP